jgi:hypothetical protein
MDFDGGFGNPTSDGNSSPHCRALSMAEHVFFSFPYMPLNGRHLVTILPD